MKETSAFDEMKFISKDLELKVCFVEMKFVFNLLELKVSFSL